MASAGILNDLLQAAVGDNTKESLCDYFSQNLEGIFTFAYKDILESLNTLDLPLLTALHKSLCEQAQAKFQQFKDLRPINRQAKHTLLPDIYHLGVSLNAGTTSKELEKIFVSKATCSLNNEETKELVHAVTTLSERVSVLEKSVIDLQSVNEALKCSISDLLSKQCQQCSNSHTSHSSEPDTEEDTVISEPFSLPRYHKRKQRKVSREAQRAAPQISADLIQAPQGRDDKHQALTKKSYAEVTKSTHVSKSELTTKNSTVTLSAAPKSTTQLGDVYIGGVHPKHTTDDIEKHLKSLGVAGTIQVKILSTKSDWRSFRARLEKEHEDKALDPSKWPEGIHLRPFRTQSEQGIKAASSSQQRSSFHWKPRHRGDTGHRRRTNHSWRRESWDAQHHSHNYRASDYYSRQRWQ